ncbi:MAG TPA: molybdopterin dinucleotide binding domain-containing protein, partial [Myxococcota bacterium]
IALLKGIMKVVVEKGGIDRAFLAEHTRGADVLIESVRAADWDEIVASSGVAREEIEKAARTYLDAERVIVCWAMGITQHKNAVGNVREIVNLLALRGMLGKTGAGVCPVRGHSNVQGDRTVGIYEAPSEAFLQRLDAGTGITSPRAHGFDVVDTIRACDDGRVKVFMALGGNFIAATPDTERTLAALRKCKLTVQVSTKLNRSHLESGSAALILPCLGRSERDEQREIPQFVTVENSMGVVHRSEGRLDPAGPGLRSECAIVAGVAQEALGPDHRVPWQKLVDDYDEIRALIEKSIAGFDRFNARVREPDGFLLPNGVRERTWNTASGKVELTVQPIPKSDLRKGQLIMMTIRSHDQFNTTIYEMNDRYRGIHGDRRVVFAHPDDIAELGLAPDQIVDVTSHFRGQARTVQKFRLVPYDIPRGCCAAYFPETNPLVPLDSQADESGTPTSKSFAVSFASAR